METETAIDAYCLWVLVNECMFVSAKNAAVSLMKGSLKRDNITAVSNRLLWGNFLLNRKWKRWKSIRCVFVVGCGYEWIKDVSSSISIFTVSPSHLQMSRWADWTYRLWISNHIYMPGGTSDFSSYGQANVLLYSQKDGYIVLFLRVFRWPTNYKVLLTN